MQNPVPRNPAREGSPVRSLLWDLLREPSCDVVVASGLGASGRVSGPKRVLCK